MIDIALLNGDQRFDFYTYLWADAIFRVFFNQKGISITSVIDTNVTWLG